MFRFFIPLLVKLGPASFRRFLLDLTPNPDLQKVKKIVDVMSETSGDIYREKLSALNNGDESVLRQMGEGKDVMSILCKSLLLDDPIDFFPDKLATVKANLRASVEERLPENELIAQMR